MRLGKTGLWCCVTPTATPTMDGWATTGPIEICGSARWRNLAPARASWEVAEQIATVAGANGAAYTSAAHRPIRGIEAALGERQIASLLHSAVGRV